jgi:zinc protease
LSRLAIPIESATLPNGLRVAIAPDSSAPVATIGVYYRIGFRLEPPGRSGFAHLFEHMMFEGSAHAGKMMHIRLVNASGGVLNGSTAYDLTNYFQAVPSNAVERVLWLEADRMRALVVNEENLRNQREVVKEEVRVNVLNQPYGGFPWLDLPPIAFRTWPNAHNFYGDFHDLDAATVEDVRAFFRTYYVPNNAVLLLLGDVEPGEGFRLAERYFADIPRGAPPRVNADEPRQNEERRGVVEEKFGALPALAIGYRAPERRTADWRAAVLLDRALHGGRAGRLYRRLALEKELAVDVDGGINYPMGGNFDYDGPALAVTRIFHKPEAGADEMIAAFDEVIAEVQQGGVPAAELEEIKVKFRSDYIAGLDAGGQVPRYGLMHDVASFTLFDDEPGLVNTILDGFLEVTPAEVAAVARKYLLPGNRAIVIRQPVGRKGAA